MNGQPTDLGVHSETGVEVEFTHPRFFIQDNEEQGPKHISRYVPEDFRAESHYSLLELLAIAAGAVLVLVLMVGAIAVMIGAL